MSRIIVLFLLIYAGINVLPELAGHVAGTWLEGAYNNGWATIKEWWQ